MVEELAKVAQSVTDALKAQPLALAMLVMNAGFLVFFWWILNAVRTDTQARFELLRSICGGT